MPSLLASVLQAADQNILSGAVITSTVAPTASYPLNRLGFNRPDWRVIWPVTTVTVTWTRPAGAARGDILIIPTYNIVTGVAVLTNGAGLSQALTFPVIRRNGLPHTLAIDLRIGTPVAATRTSSVWNLVITGNAANVKLGGGISIYSPYTALANRGFRWGNKLGQDSGNLEQENEYLTVDFEDLGTSRRLLDVNAIATSTDADTIDGFWEGCNGRGRPGLIWLDPSSTTTAYYGLNQKRYERVNAYRQAQEIGIQFMELSKGEPL